MTESTPLYDRMLAGDPPPDPTPPDPTPVDPPVDNPATDPDAPAALDLPAGPDLGDLQAFTDAIPDEGHRAIAQHLVDAFTVRDAQLVAFIAAYAAAEGQIAALQADVAALQAAVTALQPAPAPEPDPADPVPATT